jgi:hypothetical protein
MGAFLNVLWTGWAAAAWLTALYLFGCWLVRRQEHRDD